MLRVALSALLTAAALVSPASAQVVGADLRASARAVPDSASVGQEVAINGTVTNTGPQQATGVTITLALPRELVFQSVLEAPGPCSEEPPVICQVGPLPPGGAAQVRILTGVVGPGRLAATATVDAAEEDPNTANDQAQAELAADGRPCDRVGSVESDHIRAPRDGGVICGLGGSDELLGGPRSDDLLGGSGHDVLAGDAGRDRLDGGDGSDACNAEPGPGTEQGCERSVFALARKLPLVELGSTVGYGYHESLFGTAIAMSPLEDSVVMSSRGRGTGSTTAADVVVGSGARLQAPVTGRVVGVKRYLLYCERPDWKLVIKPSSNPNLRVLVLHLGRPSVEPGDEVMAGISAIGRARPNDWADSQVNRYFADRYPHVHVEVERNRASPTPGCAI